MQLHRWEDGVFRIDAKLKAVGNSYLIHSLSNLKGSMSWCCTLRSVDLREGFKIELGM